MNTYTLEFSPQGRPVIVENVKGTVLVEHQRPDYTFGEALLVVDWLNERARGYGKP